MVVLYDAPEYCPFNSTADLYSCHLLQVNAQTPINNEIPMLTHQIPDSKEIVLLQWQ